MRTAPLLISFLMLCGGRPGLTREETRVYTAVEGQNFEQKFQFYKSGQLFFCKNDCNKTEDILAQTSDLSVDKGRYSIVARGYSDHVDVVVGINTVSSSDSGSYRCEIRSEEEMDFVEFQINVTTRAVHNVTTQDRQASSEGPSHRVTLYVALAVGLILLLVTLSILYWRKRVNKTKEFNECAQMPERDHLYEEVPDQNRPAPVYSLLSPHEAQSQVEDSAKSPTYSEVGFTSSNSSAPRCLRGEGAGQTVLYSTVTSP